MGVAVNPFVLTAPDDLNEEGTELSFQWRSVGPSGPVVVVTVGEAPLVLTERTSDVHDTSLEWSCLVYVQFDDKQITALNRAAIFRVVFVFVGTYLHYAPSSILLQVAIKKDLDSRKYPRPFLIPMQRMPPNSYSILTLWLELVKCRCRLQSVSAHGHGQPVGTQMNDADFPSGCP